MIHLEDIHSLTDFQRHAKEQRSCGRVHTAYQKLLDLVDRLQAIEAIQKGLESMNCGEGKPAQEVFSRLWKKHNIQHDA